MQANPYGSERSLPEAMPVRGGAGDRRLVRYGLLVLTIAVAAGMALRAAGYVGGAYSWFFMSAAGDDSWAPMARAYMRALGPHPESMYEVFAVDGLKYQYPPSSLLLYAALDALGIARTAAHLNVIVWVSVLLNALAVFAACSAFITANPDLARRLGRRDSLLICAVFGIGTWFFYPIMISWRLGQLQAALNLAFAVACWLWIRERRFGSGLAIGLICLIKPQFCLFLLWALLRRETTFIAGFCAAVVPGTALALRLYGWESHVEYVKFLTMISRHGEIFWDNTSVNGLVNRLLHPDQTLSWSPRTYAPFSPITYASTVASSALILGIALLARRHPPHRLTIFDVMTAGLAFTLAAPVAWGHHFGVVMPMLALAFLEILRRGGGPGWRLPFALWALCLMLFTNNWNVTDALAGSYASILQSWRLAAAFVLLALLLWLQRDPDASAPDVGVARPMALSGSVSNPPLSPGIERSGDGLGSPEHAGTKRAVRPVFRPDASE